MSFFSKIKKGVKKAGRGVARGAKATGRGVARGARATGRGVKATGKAVVHHPFKTALALTTPYGAVLAYKAVKGKHAGKPGFKGSPAAIQHLKDNPQSTKAALSAAIENGGQTDDSSPEGEDENEGVPPPRGGMRALSPMPSQGDDTDDGGDDSDADDGSDEDSDTDDSDADSGGPDDEDDSAGENNMAGSEYVGWDDIAGDDDMGAEYVGLDEIGVVTPAKKGTRGPNAALVRNKGYNKARRQSMAFVSTGTVGAAASTTIQQTAQTLFRGRRLVVAAAITGSFTIDDVKVGNVSQFAATGSQVADAFAGTTIGEDNMLLDTCPPGMSIFLTCTNFSGGALTFRAVLFGDSVQ